ncbi:hypothetical protein MNV49_002202 [Pseudohyphozyma bogoriensis]|nr:hypothetical protein MNV49_002202 [Pseudohyphozyma bogoriensis]
MAPITLMPHDDIKGKFMIVAVMQCQKGKEEEMAKLLRAVRDYSNDKNHEPLTLTYRVTRGAGDKSSEFTVIEEYAEREGLKHHRTSEPYLALRNSGIIDSTVVTFYEEL